MPKTIDTPDTLDANAALMALADERRRLKAELERLDDGPLYHAALREHHANLVRAVDLHATDLEALLAKSWLLADCAADFADGWTEKLGASLAADLVRHEAARNAAPAGDTELLELVERYITAAGEADRARAWLPDHVVTLDPERNPQHRAVSAAMDAKYALADAILGCPARTLAGLRAKARAARVDMGVADVMDYDAQCLLAQSVVADLLRALTSAAEKPETIPLPR